jgi:hypothetical protein
MLTIGKYRARKRMNQLGLSKDDIKVILRNGARLPPTEGRMYKEFFLRGSTYRVSYMVDEDGDYILYGVSWCS